jgi:hypothetical protein
VRREVIPQHLRLRELLLATLVLAEVRLLALVNDLQVAIQIVDSGNDQRTPFLCNNKSESNFNFLFLKFRKIIKRAINFSYLSNK